MKNYKFAYIKCPCCGKQYLPGEIYYPKSFLGQPKWVDKDSKTGEIIDFDETMDLEEHFVCENCLTQFKVTAKVNFTTVEEKLYNFNSDYYTRLDTPSIFLDEN